ncbi:unnamed protein product, partial [Discosporangium mesarthrocarpum]
NSRLRGRGSTHTVSTRFTASGIVLTKLGTCFLLARERYKAKRSIATHIQPPKNQAKNQESECSQTKTAAGRSVLHLSSGINASGKYLGRERKAA